MALHSYLSVFRDHNVNFTMTYRGYSKLTHSSADLTRAATDKKCIQIKHNQDATLFIANSAQ